MDVILDRRRSDEEGVGDLGIAEAGSNQGRHFAFPVGEDVKPCIGPRNNVDQRLVALAVNGHRELGIGQVHHLGQGELGGPLPDCRNQLAHPLLGLFVDQDAPKYHS